MSLRSPIDDSSSLDCATTTTTTPQRLQAQEAKVTPRVVRSGLSTKDITDQFKAAALRLGPGRLVKDEDFSLFEAVSALEIGDSKMDSGCLENGETLEDEYEVSQPLTPEETVWMMDELLYHEVAWHMGYPLSQTLFTSLHVNALLWPEPKNIENARFSVTTDTADTADSGPLLHTVFRSYCLALIKACDLVRRMVMSQHFYEEEDFATQIFHRELLHHFNATEMYSLIDDGLSWIESSSIDISIREAISQRLAYRREMLRILEAANNPSQLSDLNIHQQISIIDDIKQSIRLGKAVPQAFSMKIQRTLASSVPPRPMIRIESQAAFSFLNQLLRDISHVHELLMLHEAGKLMPGFWTFMAQTPQPSVYARAVLQSLLAHHDKLPGNSTLKTFIFDDLQRLVLPGSTMLDSSSYEDEVSPTHRFQFTKQLDDFISRCGQSYLDVFRTFCLNRCRIRRTLCHAIVEWDHLQAEAEECDGSIQVLLGESAQSYPPGAALTYSYPLSSWIYHYKLLQMELIVLTGFELSIYAPDEIPKIYWQLSQIATVHLAHLDRMSHFADLSARQHGLSNVMETTEKADARIASCLRELFREYTRLKAIEALAKSLHLLFAFLARNGLLTRPSHQYGPDKLRYELRMRPFLHLSVPEPMSFDEYQEAASLPLLSDEIILDRASRECSIAKRTMEQILKTNQTHPMFSGAEVLTKEWTKDGKETMRACIATGITIMKLKEKLAQTMETGKMGSLRHTNIHLPAFGEDGSWHRWWVVPKIGN